jgi:hypothetical protein
MALRLPCQLAACLAAFGVAGAALPAAAGGIELNDAAASIGIDPMDAPGYPIQISEPGRYHLTGDLHVPPGSAGIEISASNVLIDFAGHEMSPKNGGAFAGVLAMMGPAQRNITLRNGTIRQLDLGIDLGLAMHTSLESMRVHDNNGPGYLLGELATVRDTEANGNVGCGGTVGQGSSISDSSASGNGTCGLTVGKGSKLSNVKASHNADRGIIFYDGGSGSDILVSSNEGDGILLEDTSPGDPFRSIYEFSELTVTLNGFSFGGFGLKAQDVKLKIRNGMFGGNGIAGLELHGSDVSLGSVTVTDNGGTGLSSFESQLTLSEVTVSGNGAMGFGDGIHAMGPTGEVTAHGLVVRDNSGAGVRLDDVDGTLHDFTIRKNGMSSESGITVSGTGSTLTLRDGVLKDNAGYGVSCIPPAANRAVFGHLNVDGNGMGALSGCVQTELGDSSCNGGGPGSC